MQKTMPVTVKKNHQQVKRMMREDVAAGENKAIAFLVDQAKQNIRPHNVTGHLEGSIEQTVEASTGKPAAEAKVGASYGRIVDQGTAHKAGTYFWTRALLAMQRKGEQFFRRR